MIQIIFSLLASCNSQNDSQSAEKVDDSIKVTQEIEMNDQKFHPELKSYISSCNESFDEISGERKTILDSLSTYLNAITKDGKVAKLTFICTHNSRRSQMSQVWAAAAAHYYEVGEGIESFSGGTEATAFNPRAVEALERAGFEVDHPGGTNPPYDISFMNNGPVLKCFSKKYDDAYNPSENFIAIMTCSDADEACPIVRGAEARFSLPYEDPKAFDDTDQEKAAYDERCKQIATELLYVFSNVKKRQKAI